MSMSPLTLRVDEILAELNWTQKDLAEQSGLSENAISKLIRRPFAIRLDTIEKICTATGKQPGELFKVE